MDRDKIALIYLITLFGTLTFLIPAINAEAHGGVHYLVDSKASLQTPKYLGVNVEVMLYHDQSNMWDWLADSGAQMAREIHPDKDMRKVICAEAIDAIKTKDDFEAFRKRLLSDPDSMIPWNQFRFDEHVKWLGVLDGAIRKTTECGVKPIISIAYTPPYFPGRPAYFPRPLVKEGQGEISDADIDWGAAASAYEYYLAHIYRYASRYGVTHYLMMNEPWAKPHFLRQIGKLAQLARLALEDVRNLLTDQQTAQGLWLSGPACHHGWDEIWTPIEPYIDSADFHFYDFAPDLLKRKITRAVIRTRQTDKKFAMSEFNRIGMRMQPDQSTQCFFPALELAEMLMTVLSGTPADHPGFEFALLYQFQSPATHRSFKSLIYGDTNYVDWSVVDKGLRDRSEEWYPDFKAMQLRFPTPSYYIFKMMSRCTPGNRESVKSYNVLALGESVRGFTPARDTLHNQNISHRHYPEKFFAYQGVGPHVHSLAVQTPDKLIFLILNTGPTPAENMTFSLELLNETYKSAVVRELSLKHFDKAIHQFNIQNNGFTVNAPPESLTQVILTRHDLLKVTDLKLEEITTTPGTVKDLDTLETTRFKTLGKINNQWIDLTDLNVTWTSSTPDIVSAYQTGLIQRTASSSRDVIITAQTLNGITSPALTIPGNLKNTKMKEMIINGNFEEPVESDQHYIRKNIDHDNSPIGLAPVKGWFYQMSGYQWLYSTEHNHTSGGNASLKLTIDKNGPDTIMLTARPNGKDTIDLETRFYKVSAWVLRPNQNGLKDGKAFIKFDFKRGGGEKVWLSKNVKDIPSNRWVQLKGIVEAPSKAFRARIHFGINRPKDTEGILYVDDISIKPIPSKN